MNSQRITNLLFIQPKINIFKEIDICRIEREICICFLKNNQKRKRKINLIPKKNDQRIKCDYGG